MIASDPIVLPALNRNPTIRTEFRRRRRALSKVDRESRSRAVCQNLKSALQFPKGEWIGVYHADDGEVDLTNLIDFFWKSGLQPALPIIREGEVKFASYLRGTTLQSAAYDLLEPQPCFEINHNDIGMILAPLVAFSVSGHRLGRGGGYYDRFLKLNRKPAVIGIAYGFQVSEDFTTHDGDMPLHAAVTELKLWNFNLPNHFLREGA